MKTLGERLTELREHKGWTKTYVAKKLGIKTLSTYANYEYGDRQPDMDTLTRICNLYDISLDELIGRDAGVSKRTIRGKEIDINDLTENQKTILEWAMKQESLSAFNDKDDLTRMLDDIGKILKYESLKAEKNTGKKE